METNKHTTQATLVNTPHAHGAFERVHHSVKAYGALSTLALLAVIAVSGSGHLVNTFMWVRAGLLPVAAVLLYRMTVAAAWGSRRAFERLSALTVIMPIAIVGVDLIPGLCPPWYALMQALCVLPLIPAACVARSSALRAAFPTSR
ncbi:hypothetical protein AB0I66_35155 [Streptomyces sp. NPDC050439]|uniref:hypothetical protein n=1 Tax=unclassified Streptomyces TaxID=2593676 RepID=UPI003449AC13